MRSARNDSSSSTLWIVGLVVLLLAGGGVVWLLGSSDAPQTDTAPSPLERPDGGDETPTQFTTPAPERGEVKPIEVGPPLIKPRLDAPAVLAGGPVGCIEGFAVDSKNLPIEGVKITLFLGNALLTAAFPGTRQPVDGSAVTGPDGRFSICDVPAARNYVVVGEHDTYARSEANGFTVLKDSITSGVVLHMSDGAVIQGVVTEVGGNPLPGARVELYYTLDMAFLKPEEQRPAQVVFTNGQGRYAFAHVSAQSIKLSALAEGFASQSHNVSYALEVAPRDQEINFELDLGASLPGRVVNVAGAPIAGARVEVTSLAKENQGSSIAYSDDGGYFILDGMSRDKYQLRCAAEGYSEKIVPGVDISAGHYTVTMDRQGGVTGWVTNVANAPVRNFSLHLMRAHHGVAEPNYLNDNRSFSDKDGRFQYDRIDPGTYVLEARANDYADARSEAFTIEQNMDQYPQLRIQMLRGGTICGTVLDSTGKPLAGAIVSLNVNNFIDSSIAKIFKAIAPSDERERKLRTDPDGRYCIANITPGTYQIMAQHDDAAARIVNDVVVVDEDAGGNRPVDLTLPRGAVIAGRAVENGSSPLAYCKVQISTKDNSYMETGTTDLEGKFSFPNLRADTYQLTVNPERVNGEPIHPIMRLVYAKNSTKEVFVNEGQVLDGVLLELKAK